MSTPRTHPLNVSYLVIGLVFLGLAGSWALREAGVVDLAEVTWLFPLTLVVAGVIGLVAMAAKGLSRQESDTRHDTYDHDSYDHDSYEGDRR
jgi:hypothetical protein